MLSDDMFVGQDAPLTVPAAPHTKNLLRALPRVEHEQMAASAVGALDPTRNRI
jgi:hypothetical protein